MPVLFEPVLLDAAVRLPERAEPDLRLALVPVGAPDFLEPVTVPDCLEPEPGP